MKGLLFTHNITLARHRVINFQRENSISGISERLMLCMCVYLIFNAENVKNAFLRAV
jgi:hypothetical protein